MATTTKLYERFKCVACGKVFRTKEAAEASNMYGCGSGLREGCRAEGTIVQFFTEVF